MASGRVFDHNKLGFSDFDPKLARRRLSVVKQPRLVIGVCPSTRDNPRPEMNAWRFNALDFLSDLVSSQDTFRDENLLQCGDHLLCFKVPAFVFHYECVVLAMIRGVAIPVRMWRVRDTAQGLISQVSYGAGVIQCS
jgi:hypothetical protein